MSAPAHFSSKISTEEERKIRELEENAKRGSPKLLLSSYATIRCNDCFCILKAVKTSHTKKWLTQCKHHHCWIVDLENGPYNLKLERIPIHDPRYPRRNKG